MIYGWFSVVEWLWYGCTQREKKNAVCRVYFIFNFTWLPFSHCIGNWGVWEIKRKKNNNSNHATRMAKYWTIGFSKETKSSLGRTHTRTHTQNYNYGVRLKSFQWNRGCVSVQSPISYWDLPRYTKQIQCKRNEVNSIGRRFDIR